MQKRFPGQAKNEKVLFYSKENIVSYIVRHISVIFIFFALELFVIILSWFFSLNIWVEIIFILIPLLILCILYIFWNKTYFIVTNKRLLKFVRNGIFTEHMKELKLDQLNELTYRKKGVIQKLFNIGNIKIVGKDKENVIWYEGVLYPDEVVLYVSRLRDFLKENPNYNLNELKEFKPRKERYYK